ncbi:MAG: putative hydro-lyase [Alphaproteobacteria bacterium]|nr:putative hydro-lyase [Alphaproteobacteria bacterium]MCY4319473.1 putative hydro-lyase [Alphaproteobacteria bacterium]
MNAFPAALAKAAHGLDIAWDATVPREVRRHIRTGDYRGHTGGLARGYVQANLAILPRDYADEFLRFCQRNPKPCPLLAVSEPGDPRLPGLAEDLDIRTDISSYRVFRDGEYDGDVVNIEDLWQEDFVVFALGCSFSFEEPLVDAGLRLRHWEDGSVCPMFLTDIECAPAGRFRGRMVVSMRPFTPADAIKAVQITSRYPRVHGAPVHLSMPELIGIEDVGRAWQGDDPVLTADEMPVFWACGVTPQVAIRSARPPLAITHTPAHMLVTDRRNASLAVG